MYISKTGRAVCGLLALIMSSCGGGGGGGGAAQPLPTVTADFLYSFGSTPTDAVEPSGVLLQGSDGNFYGTTTRGGLTNCPDGSQTTTSVDQGCGTVFKLTSTGQETILHLFGETPADGTGPTALIQGNDGNFYGTTGEGGVGGLGTVFMLTPDGAETILYSFAGGSDGAGPVGLIQGSDGNFYGTTSGGGVNDLGTVFKLTPKGVETVLYSFGGIPQGAPEGDGAYPVGQLVQGSDGNFYGVTMQGGVYISNTNGDEGGTVFKITPEGIETILYRFSGPDGQYPSAGLILGSDGNLYGTTGEGPASLGAVFEITPEGVETTVHAFSGSDGMAPEAGLIQAADGNFYGTTSSGGAKEAGTLFQLTPAGDFATLLSFTDSSAGPATNLVQGTDGNLYGTTYQGGAHDLGSFFKLIFSGD